MMDHFTQFEFNQQLFENGHRTPKLAEEQTNLIIDTIEVSLVAEQSLHKIHGEIV